MKKIKLIIPATCCLLATSLFSCAQKPEQPVSNFYKISVINAANGPLEKPSITFVNSNFVEKGKDCDVYVRFEDYYELNPLEGSLELYQIRKSNFLSEGDILTQGYSVDPTDDPCVYKIHIDKEYMTTSYDVIVNCSYVDGDYHKDNIKFKSNSKLENMTNLYVTNTSALYDLTFILMPKNFQSGYTFNAETKDAIEIYGLIPGGGEDNLTDYLTRKELVRCDSPIQGLSHYFTDTNSLRVAIPVDKLYESVKPTKEHPYGYESLYSGIEIRSTKTDAPLAYDVEHYKSVFNPTADSSSCYLDSSEISFDETSNDVHYNAVFKAQDGYSFPSATSQANFSITDLTILPKSYTPTGHPYFRSLELHSSEKLTPYIAYRGEYSVSLDRYIFEDANGNAYYAMNDCEGALSEYAGWLNLTHTDSKTLKVDINITNLVKYVELPVTTIFTEYDAAAYGYQDGSIDFIQSMNFTIKAYK